MPLIHITAPEGTFSDAARDALAEAMTVTALRTEQLPLDPFDKSTCWIYFHELPAHRIYHGGQAGGTRVIALEVNIFEGNLDADGKRLLFSRLTDLIREHAGIAPGARVPAYIVIRDVPTTDWGVFGGTTTIDDVRRAHPELDPI